MRGDLIGQQDEIRICHNRFARPEPFVSDEKKEADESAEAFHFVAYIEKNGAVYELDGLKGGPIRIGPVEEGTNWISSVATPEIQRRCAELGEDAVKFSLMAVMGNRKKQAELDIIQAKERRDAISKAAQDMQTPAQRAAARNAQKGFWNSSPELSEEEKAEAEKRSLAEVERLQAGKYLSEGSVHRVMEAL